MKNDFGEAEAKEIASLSFPPTEIYRNPSDQYILLNTEWMNTFLYPCDFPRRKYQYDICQVCFQYNTLVCLPTGTGKTFIAAVVMMNFYRWYPKGKIIFLAPTRALVQQQIDACRQFSTIPDKEVSILTGAVTGENRNTIWDNFSVIYATPQTIQNEITKKALDPTQVTLLILDEAHHAHKNHSYAVIVRKIAEQNSQFRIVGLSATPGNDIPSIQDIIFNLMISKIIYMDESDTDLAQYQHSTDIEIITVPMSGDVTALSSLLNESISFIATPLYKAGAISSADPKFLSRGKVFFEQQAFKGKGNATKDFFGKMNSFGILISLASMMEKLQKYGSPFLDQAIKLFEKKKMTLEKQRLMDFAPFKKLIEMTTQSKCTSHPKLARLSLILEEFFSHKEDSRAIVFTNYRNVASDIANHLKTVPNVKCSVFTGKSASNVDEGQDHSVQLAIVSLFKKGNINCIVATCVAEEGLDIGEVDLIICYDTQSSPRRTVQRMGRTGRKRAGKVVFLMTEGIEEKQLAKAQSAKSGIRQYLTRGLSKFTLYDPQRPVLPLPNDLRCIKLRCATRVNSPSSEKKVKEKIKGPGLQCEEAIEFSASNTKFKYRKMKLASYKEHLSSPIVIVSHSSESRILESLSTGLSQRIPDSINDEISKLFQVEKQPLKEDAPKYSFLSSDDDSVDDIAAYEPEETFVKKIIKESNPSFMFLSDTEDEIPYEETLIQKSSN